MAGPHRYGRDILGDQVTLTGKIDRIARDRLTGEYIIEDSKTVQSLDQSRDVLQVDDQGLIYCMLVRGDPELGMTVNRFRHNSLKKVLRSAKATPPFYDRFEVRYNEEHLDNAWTHTIVTVQRMVQALQAIESDERLHHAYTIPNPSRDCSWICDFVHACPMMDDGSHWGAYVRESGIYVRGDA
jgi:hypothetical protein